MSPSVSVLMPVRNGMPYLREAVESIVSQSFQDWEMVVVENGSTDGTVEFLQTRRESEARMTVVTEERPGVARSLNKGLAVCSGTWIARIDADDRAMPRRLEKQAAFMAINPDVVTVSCFAYYINEAGRRVALAPHDLTTREAYARYMSGSDLIGLLHPGAFIRRDALLKIGGYRADYEPAEDIDLWNRLSELGPVLVLPEFLMEYRLHPTSMVAMNLKTAHMKREWARECMLARRRGDEEPGWDRFQYDWNKAPLWERMHRRRELLADGLTRMGRQDLAAGQRAKAITKIGAAAMLRPTYTVPHLLQQMRAEFKNRTAGHPL
jgi:glycosyltransferase involved in cell wall biosynthesis